MSTAMEPENWDKTGPQGPPKHMKKEFLSFIKNIATFKGDLSSFTVPAFILSTTSLVESPTYWVEQPTRFIAPSNEDNPQKRALLVLTWLLTTLKQQYDHRKDRKRGKPLNPVLGEIFLASVESETCGRTQIVSEQVSHHPPVTAYQIWNADHGITLSGYHAAKTFWANRAVNMHKLGHVTLHLDKYNEDHLITFPQLHLEGFIPPPPYPEFDAEPVYIQSSSGFTTKITFSGKGWLRGKKNSFVAVIYPEGRESETLYTATGQWTGSFTIRDAKSDAILEEYDAATSPERLTRLTVAQLDQQDAMESRRLWSKFSKCMRENDLNGVSAEKNRIEVRQRALRVEEEEEGRKWEGRYFVRGNVDSKVEALCAKVGVKIEPEVTGGFWVFDQARYEGAVTRKVGPYSE